MNISKNEEEQYLLECMQKVEISDKKTGKQDEKGENGQGKKKDESAKNIDELLNL